MKNNELKRSLNPVLMQFYPFLSGIKRLCLFALGGLVAMLVISCTPRDATLVTVPPPVQTVPDAVQTVPPAVQTAFAAKFPEMNPTWETKPYGYEGVFTQSGVEYEAEFSFDGRWLETEYEVVAAAFPKRVLDRVQQDFPGFIITKYEIELTPQGTFYELEIQQGNQEQEIYYDSQANPSLNTNEDA